MFSLPSTVRIFVHSKPADMHKSFDGLAAIVNKEFSKDLFAGDSFVFFNRSLDRCKILLRNRDGFVIWVKRLEHGRVRRALHPADGPSIKIDTTTLSIIVEGADLEPRQRRHRDQRPRESSTY
jgi:transposase